MKKQRWYVITYQDRETPEEVIGFKQALAFRRKIDAEKEYKLSGYHLFLIVPWSLNL